MTMIPIETIDGSGSFEAYVAEPEGTPRAAIVVIQEIFGVNPGSSTSRSLAASAISQFLIQ